MTKQLPSHLRKAFLNVSRRPHTVHESSSILAHLNRHYGPVVYFRPLLSGHDATVKASTEDQTIYQILFDVTHASTSAVKRGLLDESFQVAVSASNPDVEDPFNVRGLQDRLLAQAEDVTFECGLSDTPPVGLVAQSTEHEWPTTTVGYSSSYKAAKQGAIFAALQGTGAPRGMVRNLVPLPASDDPQKQNVRESSGQK